MNQAPRRAGANRRGSPASGLVLFVIVTMALVACGESDRPAAEATDGAAATSSPPDGSGVRDEGILRTPSASGRYVVELRRERDRRHAELHEWRIRVLDQTGAVIPPGPIAFDGAMPAHRHGFPNRPLITGQTADGWYRVEGVRFHMPGAWVLRVEFMGAEGMDRAELALDVPY